MVSRRGNVFHLVVGRARFGYRALLGLPMLTVMSPSPMEGWEREGLGGPLQWGGGEWHASV